LYALRSVDREMKEMIKEIKMLWVCNVNKHTIFLRGYLLEIHSLED
jgi:hypothetical protein